MRPLSMWENPIDVDGKTVKRFEFIGKGIDSDRQHELRKALRAINSTISKCEKAELKLKDGSPQKTLTVRRIKALRIAVELISKELEETS